MAKIRFQCPDCKQQVEVDSSLASPLVECPHCRRLVAPASASAARDPFDDLFEPRAATSPTEIRAETAPRSADPARLSIRPEPATALPDIDLLDDMRWTPPHAPAVSATGSVPQNRRQDLEAPPLPADWRDPFSTRPPDALPEIHGNATDALDLFSYVPGPSVEEEPSKDVEDLATPDDLIDEHRSAPITPTAAASDDLLSLDLPDYQVDIDLGGADPLADDPNAPLRIEGISPNIDLKDVFSVRCPICESRLSVPRSQAGEMVQCPDCFSSIKALESVEKSPAQRWSQGSSVPFVFDESSRHPQRSGADLFGEGELRLAEPDPDPLLAAGSELPANVEMLPPRAPAVPQPPQPGTARWKTSPTEREEKKRQERESQQAAAIHRPGRWAQIKPRPASAESPPTTKTAPPFVDTDVVEQGKVCEITLGQFGLKAPVLWRWVGGFFESKELLIRFGGCVVALGLSWWCLNIVRALIFGEEPIAPQLVTLAGCSFLAALFGVAGLTLLGLTCAQVFELAVERRSRFDADPGWAWQDWGAGFQYLLIGLFVGGLPGAVFGTFVWLALSSMIAMQICWALSALLLAPLVLVNSYYNGTPYYIVAPAVMKTFRGNDLDWLRYVPAALACWFVLVVGLFLGSAGGLLFSIIGAMVCTFTWIAYVAVVGLYCALMVAKVEEQA